MSRVEIIFTEDFGGRKKDDIVEMDSMLASGLIRHDKVAKLTEKEVKRFAKLAEAGKVVEGRAVRVEADKKAKKAEAKAKGNNKAKAEENPKPKAPEKKSESKDKTE